MTINWNNVKWIFKPEGSLRDIYVKNVNIADLIILIDYLNQNYLLKYGTTGENKIDKDYVLQYLNDDTGESEIKTASIFIGEIMINIHFFDDTEIEFDIDPSEINSNIDFEIIIRFMNNISQILNKEVILTGENESEYPLITVNYLTQSITVINKNQEY
ncbi:hypothetical protein GKZ90_0020805 [Flavobacterium sp. MC2016-06]|jgi:hypothetical protein|uniref:hypothetical protein n=1 Tax=Flavobacterium sp. MC2016-06 TaxID=2676308 RepID=UPI0012BB1487|nr:hypothetical protein [Flavobacterium sp. MC2016-06]MBU3860792.1 hypothetical protein [Flavobacterium sp. MC2016-06]